MNELQEKMLAMLSWFHRFCVEHQLRYFVVGGTALGAKRHQGFIPWDDDIDVGMPRVDYERFKVLSAELPKEGQYTAEFPAEKKDFVYSYGKVYDTTTTLIEPTRYHTTRGIFIDVFPLDGMGNTEDEALRNFRDVDQQVKLLSAFVCALRKTRQLKKNLAIILARCIPGVFVDSRKIIRKIDALSKRYAYESSEYVANCVGNWHEKEIMKREWFGTPTLYRFETIDVYGPENLDAYLMKLYGDYMQLPPKEKQVSHHDYVLLDLSTPYRKAR